MPGNGLAVENADGKRFGAWLMPDNQSGGDLETFLRHLVPGAQEPIWQLACESVAAALLRGARCRESHLPKAQLYTWLAWQDPPGYSPGLALTRKMLQPQSVHAEGFVRWFRNLYRL
jgi:hypothetical protein